MYTDLSIRSFNKNQILPDCGHIDPYRPIRNSQWIHLCSHHKYKTVIRNFTLEARIFDDEVKRSYNTAIMWTKDILHVWMIHEVFDILPLAGHVVCSQLYDLTLRVTAPSTYRDIECCYCPGLKI